MSETGLAAFLTRLQEDTAFRERMDVDPEGGVASYHLDAEAEAAVLAWDADRIEAALGSPLTADQRTLIGELGGTSILSAPAANTPVDEPVPFTPGGRLSSDGYRGHSS